MTLEGVDDESDLAVLERARTAVKAGTHNTLVAWTMRPEWNAGSLYQDARVRGSAWIGAKYHEVKTGVLFAGEMADNLGSAGPVYEIWGQESDLKGLRLVKFEAMKSHMLKWIGPYDGAPDAMQTAYHRHVLEATNWIKLS